MLRLFPAVTSLIGPLCSKSSPAANCLLAARLFQFIHDNSGLGGGGGALSSLVTEGGRKTLAILELAFLLLITRYLLKLVPPLSNSAVPRRVLGGG